MTNTMETRNNVRPYLPVHPGEILKAELKERGIKQKDFADMIGMRPSHLNALLHGSRNISPQLAQRIEYALGIPAQLWLNLQTNYNLDVIRTSELVDGYQPSTKPGSAYALASPTVEEKTYWDMAFRAGQKDIIGKIESVLEVLNLSNGQAAVLKRAMRITGHE